MIRRDDGGVSAGKKPKKIGREADLETMVAHNHDLVTFGISMRPFNSSPNPFNLGIRHTSKARLSPILV